MSAGVDHRATRDLAFKGHIGHIGHMFLYKKIFYIYLINNKSNLSLFYMSIRPLKPFYSKKSASLCLFVKVKRHKALIYKKIYNMEKGSC